MTSPENAVAFSEPAQTEPPVIPQNISVPSRLRRILFAPVKFFSGIILCQSVLGALAVIGWTYRLMQRSVLKQWWKLSVSSAKAGSFAAFVASDTRTGEHVHWPNWFLTQNFRGTSGFFRRAATVPGLEHAPAAAAGDSPSPSAISAALLRQNDSSTAEPAGEGTSSRRPRWARSRNLLKALITSFWLNVRLGVQGAFNTWVLTLPACVLMLFGWYDGWNNSFNKGYEQFLVAPGISWLGIMLFIAEG